MSSTSGSRAKSYRDRPPRPILLLLAILAADCGADTTPGSDAASRSGPASSSGSAATLELGPKAYSFARVTCDLEDRVPDDILVRATGTAPDGRRMHLEVERREVGGLHHDRVTITFGSIVDGDQWSATASALPDGGWARTSAGGEPLDGPLVVIGEDGLRATGTFAHETREEKREGSLVVRCAGPA